MPNVLRVLRNRVIMADNDAANPTTVNLPPQPPIAQHLNPLFHNDPPPQPDAPISPSFKDLRAVADACPPFNGHSPKVEVWIHICKQQIDTAELTGIQLQSIHKVSIMAMKFVAESEAYMRWVTDSGSDGQLKTDWNRFLDWLQQFAEVKNRALDALIKLKRQHQHGKSVDQVVSELNALLHDLPEMPAHYKNLLFVAALDQPLQGLVSTSVQHKMSETPFATLVQNAKALGQTSSTSNTRALSSQPKASLTRNAQQSSVNKSSEHKNGPDLAVLLKSLSPVTVDGATYKPSSVKDLKASLKESNPDANKLRAFLNNHKLCLLCRDKGHIVKECPSRND
jgi:hypothetical protein